MRKSRIVEIFKFLGSIKLNKITNKDVRNAIISNHLRMYKVAQEHDEEIKELQKRLFEGKEEQVFILNKLREEYKNTSNNEVKIRIIKKINNEFSEILSLEQEFNDIFNDTLKEEKEVTLKKVSQEDFIQACVEADVDITSSDLIILTDLFE